MRLNNRRYFWFGPILKKMCRITFHFRLNLWGAVISRIFLRLGLNWNHLFEFHPQLLTTLYCLIKFTVLKGDIVSAFFRLRSNAISFCYVFASLDFRAFRILPFVQNSNSYRISSYSFRGNYSFLTLALCTVTFGYST